MKYPHDLPWLQVYFPRDPLYVDDLPYLLPLGSQSHIMIHRYMIPHYLQDPHDFIWLVVWNHGILWLSIQLGRIIPTDELHDVSEGWVETTNQSLFLSISSFTNIPIMGIYSPYIYYGLNSRYKRLNSMVYSRYNYSYPLVI